MKLTLPALALQRRAWDAKTLYREAVATQPRSFELTLVPYYAWGNRGDTDMSVWIPTR